ncbi:Uma2 family endonuclease [Embleya sp. NPDC020630]|uniref:Uma2 family endonuclease n=1 Tax=Embleya sp. NPDC020630 TaxID=3363979 RepID=UPI0037B09416
MSTVTERAAMSVEQFERMAEHTRENPDDLWLELIGGKVGVKAMPDGDHVEIVMWLVKLFARLRSELTLYTEHGLQVEQYRNGRARPDAMLAPEGTFLGQGEWSDPTPVLMVVEVTSFDGDTDKRDRKDKPRAYAETGIPLYLLIDRDSCETIVHSEPEDGRYTVVIARSFGKRVHLPAPVDLTIDTDRLLNMVR